MSLGSLVRIAALCLILELCVTGCQSRPPARGSSAATSSVPTTTLIALALGYENDLVEFDVSSGHVGRRLVLGERPWAPSSLGPGHYMAAGSDGKTVYILIRRSNQAAAVVALDRRTLARQWSQDLPTEAGEPRALAVGPRSGSVFAFTNQTWVPGGPGFAPRAQAVMTQLDAVRGHVQRSLVLRDPDLDSREFEDWSVLRALFSYDETRLYVSFHNQGLFDFDITASGPIARCPARRCLPAHGDIGLWNGGILAATGSNHLRLISTDGQVLWTFHTRLERNHLMVFAVDPSGKTVYAVGSCHYVPGMTSVNLETGEQRVIAPEAVTSQPCGDRVVFDSGRLLVGPDVRVLHAATGATIANSRLSALDLLF